MYHHIKKLMYTVDVGTPDPRFGRMLLEQFGGANGELAAAMQYTIQGYNCEDAARKDLLMDIGTEELSHLEVIGALTRMHLMPSKTDRDAADQDPMMTIAGGGGVNLFNSAGDAWTANYLKVTGDLAVDLHSNIAAEARAKIVYDRLIAFTDDPGSKQALQFLMTREITHMRSFAAALTSMGKPAFAIGVIAPTPELVDQYFDASTGSGEQGEETSGPWNNGEAGLRLVKSVMDPYRNQQDKRSGDGAQVSGEDFDTKPYMPKPGTEPTSPNDSTPVGEDTGGSQIKQGWEHLKSKIAS